MKDKKKRIDIYSTTYPVDLIVANEPVKLEDLSKLYKYSNNVELDGCIIDSIASTCTVKDKSTGKFCMLVKYNHPTEVKDADKKEDLLATCTHEAIHVMMDIYDYIGETLDTKHQEVFAYNVEYIAKCIYKTLVKE